MTYSARVLTVLVILVVLLLTSLWIVTLQLGIGSTCSTDSDCAAWEVRMNVPEADRCYGAPCPRD